VGTDGGDAARLTWTGADALSDDLRAMLMGPGGPFEVQTRTIRGFDQQVFVNQPPTLRAMFEGTVARMPDATFIVDGDRRWSMSEAIADIDTVGRHLRDTYGISPGDRVAIVAANSPEYLLTMWAAVSIGAIVTGLNGWWTGPEITHGMALAAPSILVGDDKRLARVESVPDGVPVLTLEALVAEARAEAAHGDSPVVDRDPDDPVVILFTSGTTGRAKGATLSHRNIINFAWTNMLSGAIGMMTAPPAPPPPADAPPPRQMASIVASPMFHISGLVAAMMTGPAFGMALVFPPPGRWDPITHLQLTQDNAVSAWSGVPTQFWRLLKEVDGGDWDVSTVTSLGGGGATFPPELVREVNRVLPNAVFGSGYGMTESMGIGTLNRGPDFLAHPDSVGTACPFVEVEVRDETGRALPEDEIGEVHLRSASIFIGYWNDPEATARAIDAQGWYSTGDFGRISNGRLYLESRMRDLIIRGGENIYPIEIENRLIEHPAIVDAAVIGVDHPELGQEVKAFVVLDAGAALTEDDVRTWVGEALARFKVPSFVEFRTELPYTQTGKLHKRTLEDEEKSRS
jgi:acyl-CoA synthetase (AMP-forming)/AMP-acid ligase II